MEITNLESDIKEMEYDNRQQVPVKLTDAESLKYSNKCKSYSYQVAELDKCRAHLWAVHSDPEG